MGKIRSDGKGWDGVDWKPPTPAEQPSQQQPPPLPPSPTTPNVPPPQLAPQMAQVQTPVSPPIPTMETPTAIKIRASEFVGVGCFIQGVGILCPFVGFMFAWVPGAVFGLLAGLGLLLAGGRKAIVWKCGACMNRLSDGDIRVCPVCKASLRE